MRRWVVSRSEDLAKGRCLSKIRRHSVLASKPNHESQNRSLEALLKSSSSLDSPLYARPI